MKRFSLLLAAAFTLFAFIGVQAQIMPTYRLTVQNQRVVDNALKFDVYIYNTSIQPMYVGECDLWLNFSSQNFKNVSFEFVPPAGTRLASGYGFSTMVQDGRLGVAINTPNSAFTTKDDFIADVESIPNEDRGVLLGTAIVTGITNSDGTSGLSWVTDGKLPTLISTFSDAAPYTLYFINNGGTFDAIKDVVLKPTISAVDNQPSTGVSTNISVYPNPVKNNFTVKTTMLVNNVTVKIFNVSGNEVLSTNGVMNNGEMKMELPADISSGNYILKVQDSNSNEMIGSLPLVVVK